MILIILNSNLKVLGFHFRMESIMDKRLKNFRINSMILKIKDQSHFQKWEREWKIDITQQQMNISKKKKLKSKYMNKKLKNKQNYLFNKFKKTDKNI